MEGSYCKHVFTACREGDVMLDIPDIIVFKIVIIAHFTIMLIWSLNIYPSLSSEGKTKAFRVAMVCIMAALGVAAYN